MRSDDPNVQRPTPEDRVAARSPAPGPVVMYQRWRDLLFLHWTEAAELIQQTLPEGLYVDTYQGQGYLGIVPFRMSGVRPRGLPPVPGLSSFLELNLRTYVHDRLGMPGVWFYSLDANQPLAVEVARRLFHLPYRHATMNLMRQADGTVDYRSGVRDAAGGRKGSRFVWRPGPALPAPLSGSLEFFLVERYRLYAASGNRVWRGGVFHAPYPVQEAKVEIWEETLLAGSGFPPISRPPDHVICSVGVDVQIHPLRRI